MWTTVSASEQNTAPGGQSAFDVLGGFTLTEKHNISGFILANVHFNYSNVVANSDAFGAFGLIVVEDDALTVPQVPEPFTDGDAPWMLHQYYHDNKDVIRQSYLEPSTRARRRIAIKESIAFVLDVAAGSDNSLNWSVYIRLLLQRGR